MSFREGSVEIPSLYDLNFEERYLVTFDVSLTVYYGMRMVFETKTENIISYAIDI